MTTANLTETVPLPTVASLVPAAAPVREEAGTRAGRSPYLSGLDRLRAVSVLAVLLYHAGVPWLPGGFLGVEVFFGISGYRITALLLTEWGANGRVALGAFWLRRARRLLPALLWTDGVHLRPPVGNELYAETVAAVRGGCPLPAVMNREQSTRGCHGANPRYVR